MDSRNKGFLSLCVWCVPLLGGIAIVTTLAALGESGSQVRKAWDFEHDTPGEVPKGFRNEIGQWRVVVDGANHALAQLARNPDDTFNVVLIDDTDLKDVDLSVRLKAVAGELDQGGGLVWRAIDAKNYYIARYNPLEDNFRVYKVQDGKRTQFQSTKIPGDREWHTLRVTMTGDRIQCFFDGAKKLDVNDSTFPRAGRIGLWSKADAQSKFDDLKVTGD